MFLSFFLLCCCSFRKDELNNTKKGEFLKERKEKNKIFFAYLILLLFLYWEYEYNRESGECRRQTLSSPPLEALTCLNGLTRSHGDGERTVVSAGNVSISEGEGEKRSSCLIVYACRQVHACICIYI